MGLLDFLGGANGGGLLGLGLGQQGNPSLAGMGNPQLMGPSGNPYPGGMDPSIYALRALQNPPRPTIFDSPLVNFGLGLAGGNTVGEGFQGAMKAVNTQQQLQQQRQQQALANYIGLKKLGIEEKAAEEKPQVIQVDDSATGLKRAVLVQPFGKGAQWLDIKDATGASGPSQTPLNLPPGADVRTAREATAKAAVANQEEAVKSAKAAADIQPLLDEMHSAYENVIKLGATGPIAASGYGRAIQTGMAALGDATGLGSQSKELEAARQRYDLAKAAVQARITAAQNRGEGAVSNYERALYAAQFPELTALDPETQIRNLNQLRQQNRQTIEAGRIPSLGQAPQVGAVLNRPAVAPGQEGAPPPLVNQQPFPVTPQGPGGGPVRVSTQSDYARLPPGTPYIAPDGTVRTKK